METIVVNKNEFFIGLVWSILDKDIKTHIEDMGTEYGIVTDGNQAGLTNDPASLGLYSAAAALSVGYPNLILAQKISEHHYWLCIISNGDVQIGSDAILTKADAINELVDLSSLYDDSDIAKYKINVPESIGLEAGFISNIDDDFAKLISKLDINSKTLDKFAKINKLNQGVSKGIVIGILAVALSAAGFFGYKYYLNKLAKDAEFLAALKAKNMNLMEKKVSQEDLLKKALEEELKWLADEINGQSAHLMLVKIMEKAKEFPAEVAGWSLSSVGYASGGNAITAIYENNGNSTPILFRTKINPALPMSFDLKNQKVTLSIPLEKIETVIPVEDNPSEWVKENGYGIEYYMHDLSLEGIRYSLKSMKAGSRKSSIIGITDPALANKSQLKLTKYSLKADSEIDKINNFIAVLERSPNTIIKSFNYKITNSTWSFDGILNK